jgi:hypothetical protein
METQPFEENMKEEILISTIFFFLDSIYYINIAGTSKCMYMIYLKEDQLKALSKEFQAYSVVTDNPQMSDILLSLQFSFVFITLNIVMSVHFPNHCPSTRLAKNM